MTKPKYKDCYVEDAIRMRKQVRTRIAQVQSLLRELPDKLLPETRQSFEEEIGYWHSLDDTYTTRIDDLLKGN